MRVIRLSRWRVALALAILGPKNRQMLDAIMEVALGTRKTYEITIEAPILSALMHRWLYKGETKCE